MLLIYIILILVAAALWQLVRVVELSSKLKGVDPNKVTERDNRMNGRFMLLFYFLMMAFFAWQYYEYGDRMLPEASSEHGPDIDWLLNFNFLIIIVVFVITNFLLFYMGYKYYGRDGQKATYFPHNNKLEMLWTGVPAVVLFIIIFVTDTLFLPVGEEVNFQMRSRDVIHSAYFPHFRAQMNVVPGMQTYFHFKPTKTTAEIRKDPYVINMMAEINAVREQWNKDHPTETKKDPVEFDYALICNKICGASHFNMQMLIVVGTKAEYTEWMKRHKPFYAGKTPPAKMAEVK
jgi:heme/copper-type cytochrome/quinol oxidase subunit 2